MSRQSKQSAWVFGYGSLIWNPGFTYSQKLVVRLEGWRLRFWQSSNDHRGTPESPGRVATIVPTEGGRVWGVCYELEGPRDEIFAYLDHREKNGYQRHHLKLVDEVGEALEAVTYVGCQSLPSYVGPEEEEATARVIARAAGPSGANVDYLRKLHESLHRLGKMEPHVDRLLNLVDKIIPKPQIEHVENIGDKLAGP